MFKRKTLKKIIFFTVVLTIGVAAFSWHSLFLMKDDPAEVNKYYDILSMYGKSSEYLVLSLGMEEEADLTIAVDRIKKMMGLKKYNIRLESNEEEDRPAHIENINGAMTIYLSKDVKKKKEQLNVLTHELSHIYVWNIEDFLIAGCDEEKVVDTSGVFLGLGILILNGLTDEFLFIPGQGYSSEKKFYGYLSPEEFGYIFARYCAEHGINADNITPFLDSTGRRYFKMGRNYLAKNNIKTKISSKKIYGAYWCPKCGHFMKISFDDQTKHIKCVRCSTPLPRKKTFEDIMDLSRKTSIDLWKKVNKLINSNK